MKIGDDVLTAGLIVGGGIVAYTLYKSFQAGTSTAQYGATKIDDAQTYISGGVSRITGAPKYFWEETIGQGGLGLTGGSGWDNLTARVTNSGDTRTTSSGGGQSGSRRGRDTTEDSNRTLLGKDEGSWGWGYGPRKGFLLG